MSRAFDVRDSTACILARVFSVARASGTSFVSTSSGGCQDWTFSSERGEEALLVWLGEVLGFASADTEAASGISKARDASRSRTSVRAANMSPVPENMIGKAGTFIENIRGVQSVCVDRRGG